VLVIDDELAMLLRRLRPYINAPWGHLHPLQAEREAKELRGRVDDMLRRWDRRQPDEHDLPLFRDATGA
jgi:hypothetical protein